jgi:hypothetical protein
MTAIMARRAGCRLSVRRSYHTQHHDERVILKLVHPGRLADTVQCCMCYIPIILGVAYNSYAFQKTAESYTIVTGFQMQSTFREYKLNFMSPLKGLVIKLPLSNLQQV